MSVTLLIYVASLLLAVVLFYRCALLYSDSLLKSRSPILLPRSYEPIIIDAGASVAGPAIPIGEVLAINATAAVTETPLSADEVVVAQSKTDTGSLYEERLRNYKARYQLSVRETEVLEQILQNRPINEIANVLFISPRTVKFHVASLLKKTGSNSQRGLKLTLREYDRLLEEEQNKKAENNI